MLKIDNVVILTPISTILETLKAELFTIGVVRFAKMKPSGDNLMICCPNHNNGQERNPSCGVTINDKRTDIGRVHCFSCGYSATLSEMISNCFGYSDYGVYGSRWILSRFGGITLEYRKDLDLKFERNGSKNETHFVDESELQQYRFYHAYMFRRGLTEDVINRYDVGFDPNFSLNGKDKIPCITFPVRTVNGDCVFVARRSTINKIFHYPQHVDKPVYGLLEYDRNVDTLVITESCIDALYIIGMGYNAVALMGTGNKYQYEQLKQINTRRFITAFDGDEAGRKATERIKKYFGGRKIINSFVMPENKDLNDLSSDEIKNLGIIF
jgi:DNA primase (bacterial type)